MRRETSRERAVRVAVACAAVAAVLPRVWFLNRGLGQDELFTAVHFVDVDSIRATLFSNIAFNNHIFYSFLARVSEMLFGRSEWALRLPAVIFGVATVFAIFVFARAVAGTAVATTAAVLLASSPAHIVWSSQARGYSALIFFTLVATHWFFRLQRLPTRRGALAFVLTSVLGIYVHLYAALTTIVQAAVLAWQRWRQPRDARSEAVWRMLIGAFGAIVAISGALYLPVFIAMSRDVVGRGRSSMDLTLPWAVVRELSGTDTVPVVAVLIVLALLGVRPLAREKPWVVAYCVTALAAPLVGMSLARPFDLYPRFFAYWLPYYVMFVATGLVTLGRSGARYGRAASRATRVLAFACAAVIVGDWLISWPARIPNEGYRETSLAVADDDPSIGFCAVGGARSVWQYYLKRPVLVPMSMAEFQELSRKYDELRCVYYRASWQDDQQTAIAEFLRQHASWGQVNGDLFWFKYRAE